MKPAFGRLLRFKNGDGQKILDMLHCGQVGNPLKSGNQLNVGAKPRNAGL